MIVRFHGGPLHGRILAISNEFRDHWRFEFRVTSSGEDHSPIPRDWQQVAIYVRLETRAPTQRCFIGMADES